MAYIKVALQQWLSRFQRLLRSRPAVRPIEELRPLLLVLIAVRVVVLGGIVGVKAWELVAAQGNADLESQFWSIIGLTFALSLLNIFLLQKSSSAAVGIVQLGTDLVLSTLVLVTTGPEIATGLYVLVICGGALVFRMHGAVITTAAAAICYSLLFATGLHGAGDPLRISDVLVVYVSLVGIAVVAGYLSEQLAHVGQEVERQAKDLNDLFEHQRQLFRDISDGIITTNLDLHISTLNDAARAMLSMDSREGDAVHGKALSLAFAHYPSSDLGKLLSAATTGRGSGEVELLESADSMSRNVRFHARPLCDAGGEEVGRLIILSDVSHVRRIEQQLSLHERMAKLLSDGKEYEDAIYDGVIIAESEVMKRVLRLVERVADTDAAVLIAGESGTGKELIARAIHERSDRRGKAFVAINCGAIPSELLESELFGHKKGAFTGAVSDSPGLFRAAHRGTLFLDEVGELPLHMQTKLLRVLQDKRVRGVGESVDSEIDVRIVAATNRNLKEELRKGNFREDLYYRLNVVNIMLPPLRDRMEDIPLLVRHFIGKSCGPDAALPGVSPEALRMMMAYTFPGNIRELENIVERALVLCKSAVLPEHLPDEVQKAKPNTGNERSFSTRGPETLIHTLPIDLDGELAKLERTLLVQALNASHGVRKEAAELLGLNFRSLRYRLKKYQLADNDPDEPNDKTA